MHVTPLARGQEEAGEAPSVGTASSSRSDALNHNIVLISVHRAPSEAAIFPGISLHDPRDVISPIRHSLSRAHSSIASLCSPRGAISLARLPLPLTLTLNLSEGGFSGAGGRLEWRRCRSRSAAVAFIFLATRQSGRCRLVGEGASVCPRLPVSRSVRRVQIPYRNDEIKRFCVDSTDGQTVVPRMHDFSCCLALDKVPFLTQLSPSPNSAHEFTDHRK